MTKTFAVGQKFTIKGDGEWEVTKRTRCFVTVRCGYNAERCKVQMGSDGIESIAIKRYGDILGRRDYIYANAVEAPAIDAEFTASIAEQAQDEQTAHAVSDTTSNESTQPAQPDSYEIGKQIVSLKGKAKAQQALVQECGEEFLLNMYRVFPNAAPIRITMETPDELRKYVCRDVLRVVRDAEYARRLLDDVQHRLNVRYDFDNQQYLEGWAKFLEEYAAPKKVLTVEEQIACLKQGIRDARDSRAFHRHFALMWRGIEFEERYVRNAEHYTAEIHRLIKECKELKRQVIKPAAVFSEQYEVPAVVEQDKTVEDIQEVSEMTNIMDDQAAMKARWEAKQAQKERAKANRFFRTMDNQQIAFALGLYREAMEWAKTQDFSTKTYISTTRDKVEEWVSSCEAQEAKGLYDGWIAYIDHYSRMLNVRIKGHSGFDEPTNCDEEDSLVQSITDRVTLIGSDPRAIECEKAYHEELEAKHQAAMKRIEGYIQSANGGLIEYTDDLYREITKLCHNYDDEKAVRKAIAEYNCEVLSQYGTRETLITAITQANPMTIARTLYLLTGKKIGGRTALDAWSITKFLDWYMASEYYHPEQEVTVKDTTSSTEQAQPEVPVVTEAPIIELVQPEQPDSMATPDELRKYVCRDVIRAVRDIEYARWLLNDAQHRLDALVFLSAKIRKE